jgi:S-formylglutathione hydrolase FrmB
MRRAACGLLAAIACVALAGPARAGTLERIDLPSHGNVDATKVRFNGTGHPGRLVANVLLPDGFDRAKRYPVLYLLHGAGESYASWVTKTKADVVAKDLQAIVVMPDAATGFYVNQFNGGRRGDPGWERYFLDEVIPEIAARYPIRAGRRWHDVAGCTM